MSKINVGGMTTVDKRTIRAWTNRLRSGEYNQTKGTLQNHEGFCCLGVACDFTILKSHKDYGDNDRYMKGGLPHDQSNAPAWVEKISDDFTSKTGRELYELNDGFSLNELQKHARLTFY